MAIITTPSPKIDPTDGLIAYVQAIKPYHTKILEVSVEYVASDAVAVTIAEDFAMRIEMTDVPGEVIYTCGFGHVWNAYSGTETADLPVATVISANAFTNTFIVSMPPQPQVAVVVSSTVANQIRLVTPQSIVNVVQPLQQWIVAGDVTTQVAPGSSVYVSSNAGITANGKYTVSSAAYNSGLNRTTITTVEPISLAATASGFFNIPIDVEDVPYWAPGAAIQFSANETLPYPLVANTTYYLVHTNKIGVFNVSLKRYPTEFNDIINLTNTGAGELKMARAQPFVPGEAINVTGTVSNDGQYTVSTIETIGLNYRVTVQELIPATEVAVGQMQYLGSYGDPYCAIAQAPALHVEAYISEKLVFDYDGPPPVEIGGWDPSTAVGGLSFAETDYLAYKNPLELGGWDPDTAVGGLHFTDDDYLAYRSVAELGGWDPNTAVGGLLFEDDDYVAYKEAIVPPQIIWQDQFDGAEENIEARPQTIPLNGSTWLNMDSSSWYDTGFGTAVSSENTGFTGNTTEFDDVVVEPGWVYEAQIEVSANIPSGGFGMEFGGSNFYVAMLFYTGSSSYRWYNGDIFEDIAGPALGAGVHTLQIAHTEGGIVVSVDGTPQAIFGFTYAREALSTAVMSVSLSGSDDPVYVHYVQLTGEIVTAPPIGWSDPIDTQDQTSTSTTNNGYVSYINNGNFEAFGGVVGEVAAGGVFFVISDWTPVYENDPAPFFTDYADGTFSMKPGLVYYEEDGNTFILRVSAGTAKVNAYDAATNEQLFGTLVFTVSFSNPDDGEWYGDVEWYRTNV